MYNSRDKAAKCSAENRTPDKTMRIASYNILDGGEGRADPLAEVILAQGADIVAIIEADNGAVLERLSRRLDMEYIQGQGKRHAVAIYSRWPIIETITHAAARDKVPCLLEAKIPDPTGHEWIIAATHLHPRAAE